MKKKTFPRKSKRSPALRSKLELRFKEQLDESKIEYEYEGYTIPYRTKIRGGHCGECNTRNVYQSRRYLPDFSLRDRKVVLEVKGYLNSPQRTKILGIREGNPDLDFRLCFGADNKISKTSTTRYSDWCKQHGIKYCVRTLPKDWIEEFRRLDQPEPLP